MVAAHADKPELRPLLYPIVQLITGAARLVPTPRYFPLRLRLVRVLNQLSAATGAFIPVASILLECLQFSGLRQVTKGAGSAVDFSMVLKVSKTALRTTALQEELTNQVFEGLSEHLAQVGPCDLPKRLLGAPFPMGRPYLLSCLCPQYAYHVAFPELSHLVLLRLRHFAKHSTVERFRKSARQLAQAIDRNVQYLGPKRDRADFSPKDSAQVAAFLAEDRKKRCVQSWARLPVPALGAARRATRFGPCRPRVASFLCRLAPLDQFNAQLQAKAKARMAALRTSAVDLKDDEDGQGSDDGEQEEERGPAGEFSEDEEEMLGGADDLLHEDDEEDAEGDEEGEARANGKRPRSGPARGYDDAIDEDLVQDLVLSESDDDEDEDGGRPAKRPRQHQGPGKGKQGWQQGRRAGGGGHKGSGGHKDRAPQRIETAKKFYERKRGNKKGGRR